MINCILFFSVFASFDDFLHTFTDYISGFLKILKTLLFYQLELVLLFRKVKLEKETK